MSKPETTRNPYTQTDSLPLTPNMIERPGLSIPMWLVAASVVAAAIWVVVLVVAARGGFASNG